MYNVASVFTILVFVGPPHLFASGACTDNHNSCSYWAGIGECSKNPLWMLDNCPVSCKVCSGVPGESGLSKGCCCGNAFAMA